MTLYDHHLNIYLDIKHQIVKFAGNHCRFHLGVSIATSLHIKANGIYIYIYICIYINDWQRNLLLDVLQLDVWIPFIEKIQGGQPGTYARWQGFAENQWFVTSCVFFLAVWIMGLGHAGHTRVVSWLKWGGKTYKMTDVFPSVPSR